jgi:hypothetical protein
MSLAFSPGLGYILDITTVLTRVHPENPVDTYRDLNMKGRLS